MHYSSSGYGQRPSLVPSNTLWWKIEENIQTTCGSSIYYVGCSTVPSLLLFFFIIIIQPAEGGREENSSRQCLATARLWYESAAAEATLRQCPSSQNVEQSISISYMVEVSRQAKDLRSVLEITYGSRGLESFQVAIITIISFLHAKTLCHSHT